MTRTIDDFFGSRFLKAADLEKPLTLTIQDVNSEEFERPDGSTRTVPVVTFLGDEPDFVLNKTNATLIAAMFGRDIDSWAGQRITVRSEEDSSGRSTDGRCCRVCGSPDIDEPMRVKIDLGRGGSIMRTLKPTKTTKKPEPEEERNELDEALEDDDVPFD